MPSKTLRGAEKKALEGENESQDTLEVFNRLVQGYGVGIASSSPPPPDLSTTPPPSKPGVQKDVGRFKKPPSFNTRGTTRAGNNNSQSRRQHRSGVERAPSQGSQTRQAPGSDGPDTQLTDIPAPNQINVARRDKMDSQKSTQSNNGRSYDQYCRSPSPSMDTRTREQAIVEEENAGTVQFDLDKIPQETPYHGSNLPNDSGFVDYGTSRLPKHASHQPILSSPRPPETPAAPHNPFRQGLSQLLPPSQMFQSTQFSSAVKVASPTSSRPSPAEFPHPGSLTGPALSSPLKDRGLRSSSVPNPPSSPQILPGRKSSNLENRPSSPIPSASNGNKAATEAPQSELLPRRRAAPEPMAAYEPIHKSQERRGSSEVRSDPPVFEKDDDDDEELLRRRRAQSKKNAALKSLTAISVPRSAKTKMAEVEVPLTSSEKQTTKAEAYLVQCHGTEAQDSSPDEETIKDSQAKNLPSGPKQPAIVDDDSTQSDNGDMAEPVVDLTPVAEPELPAVRSRRSARSGHPVEPPGLAPATSIIPETSPTRVRMEAGVVEEPTHQPAAPELEPVLPHSTPPAPNTRSRRAIPEPRHPSSSDLTSIASTPSIYTDSTRASVSERSPLEASMAGNFSAVSTRLNRRQVRERVAKPKGSRESLRQSVRLQSRRGSGSTDELALPLPTTPAFEDSLGVSRLNIASASRSTFRAACASIKSPFGQPTSGLFSNMAFAISFQSKKPGETNDQYKKRMDDSTTLQKRIAQAGGRVLPNGFDELFEVSPGRSLTSTPVASPGKGQTSAEIQLTPVGYATGFTALIADGHSRKVKYMQALALGLPCIAPRWVTMCLDRGELVDWSPFLLCAGQSAFLDNAIRSRSLAPYDAATARLADVVAQRPKLLQGSRMLAVVKKSVQSKKMPYVFLAQVLGVSLTRVYTADEARVAVKAAEEAGQVFDWVYVDGKSVEQALFSAPCSTGQKKKRKRGSMAAPEVVTGDGGEPPLKRIRTLDDELVIQSLILGRLIEEGEMEQ
ncbi:radiation sensitive protein rad9 [Podospora pseudoanserina]|uniref:Radiation sensitive protein rad9 n=1 Tax=Podospora pseudoanserina TaxID=2609844 RepID=A0ABR0IHJ6_9PEZI|nr:radiation sensitive protein rad9 [Podospora pseudoanserina]